MPGFLYFIPTNLKVATGEHVRAAGFGYALRKDEQVFAVHTYAGPGGDGLVVSLDPSIHPAYKRESQTWRKGPGGKFWVGMETANPPAPVDLAREKVYAGTDVRLLDGNEWTIPRCVGMLEDRPATLPRILDIDDDGETTISRIHPRFARLCGDAFAFWQHWCGYEGAPAWAPEPQIQLAIDALSVNYRIGKIEVIALLKLWSTDEHGLVLRALIDADEIEKHFAARSQKKSTSAAGESNISSGMKESSPPIAPVSLT